VRNENTLRIHVTKLVGLSVVFKDADHDARQRLLQHPDQLATLPIIRDDKVPLRRKVATLFQATSNVTDVLGVVVAFA